MKILLRNEYQKINIFKELWWFITLKFTDFHKKIYLLITSHIGLVLISILFLIWLNIINLLTRQGNVYNLLSDFSHSINIFFIFGISLLLIFKLLLLYSICLSNVNINKWFKFFICLEGFLSPFGLIITLYKLLTSDIVSFAPEKPEFVKNNFFKFFDNQIFPEKRTSNLLQIENLNFIYHGNKKIHKIEHLILKKINKKWFVDHMKKTNNELGGNSYMDEKNNFSVLSNVNLNINDKPKFITIIGNNGSGKSTLIKIINNLTQDYEGSVKWKNKDQKKINIRSFAQNVAYVSQHSVIYNNITLWEFVHNGLFPHENFWNHDLVSCESSVEKQLKEIGIFQYKDQYLSKLSGGIKQKAIIARALLQNTKIIILDEPTTFLDINNQFLILNLLKKIQIENKKTIIAILHNLKQAKDFSDEVILINDGTIFKHSETKNSFKKEDIEEIFNVSEI